MLLTKTVSRSWPLWYFEVVSVLDCDVCAGVYRLNVAIPKRQPNVSRARRDRTWVGVYLQTEVDIDRSGSFPHCHSRIVGMKDAWAG